MRHVIALTIALLGLAACAPWQASTQRSFARDIAVPTTGKLAPGQCAVLAPGFYRARGCDGIEYAAPLGSRVLHRPDDGSRTVEVWYLSTRQHGVITGVDLFDLDTRQFLRVIRPYNGL